MDEKRLRGLMGLCVRAGQAVFGEDGCRRLIAERQCGVLLLDGDISDKSRKRYEDACAFSETPARLLPSGLMEEATGRPGMAMAVRAGGFSEQILRCLQQGG